MEVENNQELNKLKQTALNRIAYCKNKITLKTVLNGQDERLLNMPTFLPQVLLLENIQEKALQNTVIKFVFDNLKHMLKNPEFVGNLLKAYPNAKKIIEQIEPEVIKSEKFVQEVMETDPELLPNILMEIVTDENYVKRLLKNKKIQLQNWQNIILNFISRSMAEQSREQNNKKRKQSTQTSTQQSNQKNNVKSTRKKLIASNIEEQLDRLNDEVELENYLTEKKTNKHVIMPHDVKRLLNERGEELER